LDAGNGGDNDGDTGKFTYLHSCCFDIGIGLPE